MIDPKLEGIFEKLKGEYPGAADEIEALELALEEEGGEAMDDMEMGEEMAEEEMLDMEDDSMPYPEDEEEDDDLY